MICFDIFAQEQDWFQYNVNNRKRIANFKIEKKSIILKMNTFKKFVVVFSVESYQYGYQHASASKKQTNEIWLSYFKY